jgi:signal transduction histidine kinase
LERLVQERTDELDRAYRTLEQLDRTKSDFIEVAAHELRTPLTVIKGCAYLVEQLVDAEQKERLASSIDGICSGVDRLHEIVNSMLDVAKIDSQTLKTVKSETRMAHVVKQVCHNLEADLDERRLNLTFDGLDTLPAVYADPDLLHKVFDNLLVNAIKYTPDGGKIEVSGRFIAQNGDSPSIEVTVSDTGIGIDPEHHELIFEKFYQTGEVALHSTGRTKFKGGGPGLGLAIVRGIVSAHDGEIWVESEGQDEERCPGSKFYVRLPLRSEN